MHQNEIKITKDHVRDLLRSQFPQWANLPIEPVQSDGTDNAIFKLGANLCVRLPRIAEAAKVVVQEQLWLLQLAPKLPLHIPVPLGKGMPNEHYPWPWSIYSWFEGENATVKNIADSHQAAMDLAEFLIALHQIDSTNAPPSRRGLPLLTQDIETRRAIKSLSNLLDTKVLTAAWEECLKKPAWKKTPVWVHGDLLPANLIIHEEKLSAIIDFGLMGIGDPACDLLSAWSIFSRPTRNIFRNKLNMDEDTWMRGRGWALSIALVILPYYQHTNPNLVAVAKRIIKEILEDLSIHPR